MQSSSLPPTHVSHTRAKKGNTMLTILALAAAWGGVHALRAALRSLKSLPRRNEDMVFF
jgi:hypothetical protein